jgi:uncharacterized protein (TIGR03086 family)
VSLDPLDALDRATGEFRRHLSVVDDDDWAAATPCADWDVCDLVVHVVGGNRFASMVLSGRTASEAMEAVMSAPQLGATPLEDFEESASLMRRGFRRPGALEVRVSHPLGEIVGGRFLGLRVFDVTVHAWDLGTAIGNDVVLEEDLVESVLETARYEGSGQGFGMEPCGDIGPDSSALEQLLDLSGRRTGSGRP